MMSVQTEHTYIVIPARTSLGNRCEVHPGHICTLIGGCGALYESYGRCIKHSFQHMVLRVQISCAAVLFRTQPPSRGSQERCKNNTAAQPNLSKKSTDTACDLGLEVRRIGVISISTSIALALACAEVAPSHVDSLARSLARVRARMPSPKLQKNL